MQVPANAFREYDIRGVAERDLTDAVAHGIGRGLATMLGAAARDAGEPGARIAVGRDPRLSSPRLFEALTRGLVEGGVRVLDIGVGPTPFLYGSVHALEAAGGVMITGSHNAGDENGFKMMRGKASFYGADIQALRKMIESESYAKPAAPGAIEKVAFDEKYIEMVTGKIRLARTDMKIVVDAGNGAGGPLALRCMKKLGLSPDALFCEMDGHFPNHHPDPTVPKNLEALIKRVRETGARVGIAYDGDADRLGAVDANGDIVWGDRLMILFSRAILKENPGAAILGEVKCSQTLYDDIAKHGGRGIMWKTGHSLIKTKMKEEHALLAGEMSGHLFFADRYFGYDDALYASLRLLEILAADPRSIGEMLSDVPKTFTTPELRVDCPDAIKFDVVKAVTAKYKAAGNAVIDIDGARVSFGTPSAPAWGLVRASNTGPVLVMRFEAGSEAERDRLHAEVARAVDEERAKLTGSEQKARGESA
jgi:phosphomannomutase/phosphoglucomutase